jgi:hypothetical protein
MAFAESDASRLGGRPAPPSRRRTLTSEATAAPAPRIVHRLTVVDVTAIAKAAAVTQPVACDDGVGGVHEGDGLAPAALVEVASGAGIVPRVGHVTAMGQATDAPRLIAMRDEVGDQRLEAARKVAGNGNLSGRGGHGDHAVHVPRGGVATASMPGLLVRAPPGPSRDAMLGAVSGMIMTSAVLAMGGLCRDGNGQKNSGRCEESHNWIPFCLCRQNSPAEQVALRAPGRPMPVPGMGFHNRARGAAPHDAGALG